MYYHQPSNSIFVSNINGGVLDRDGNGYIIRIAMGGKVIAEKWATGLNAPKGIRSVGMTIWVADIDEVVGFELTASGARLVSRVRVDGSRIDGIELADYGWIGPRNGTAAYFVTDVIGRRLLHVGNDGKVMTLALFDQAGADFGVLPRVEQLVQAGTAFVPFLFANTVSAYDLYPLIRAAR